MTSPSRRPLAIGDVVRQADTEPPPRRGRIRRKRRGPRPRPRTADPRLEGVAAAAAGDRGRQALNPINDFDRVQVTAAQDLVAPGQRVAGLVRQVAAGLRDSGVGDQPDPASSHPRKSSTSRASSTGSSFWTAWPASATTSRRTDGSRRRSSGLPRRFDRGVPFCAGVVGMRRRVGTGGRVCATACGRARRKAWRLGSGRLLGRSGRRGVPPRV